MKIEKIVEIPEKTDVKYEDKFFIVKGPEGELKRKLFNPYIKIEVKDGSVLFVSNNATKREKKMIYTFAAHLKNLMNGVNQKYIYKLKICSGHFPMTVSVEGDDFIVKNFFGESIPRKLRIKKGADVKVEGDMLTVESADKEIAGQVSADIENLTKRTKYDKRIFQDGIYIILKAGKIIK